jgi:hypothetical protein
VSIIAACPTDGRLGCTCSNARVSTGANATQRTLDISGFSEIAFGAVRRHVERAGEWSLARKFEMRHSQCVQLLYQACSALFPRQQQRYSLFMISMLLTRPRIRGSGVRISSGARLRYTTTNPCRGAYSAWIRESGSYGPSGARALPSDALDILISPANG